MILGCVPDVLMFIKNTSNTKALGLLPEHIQTHEGNESRETQPLQMVRQEAEARIAAIQHLEKYEPY